MNVRVIEATPTRKIIFDIKGFFVIYNSSDKINVEHYLNTSKGSSVSVDSGKMNAVVVGTDSLTIGQTIIREGLISRVDHALYLGRELMKAEIALHNELQYEQCSDLKI